MFSVYFKDNSAERRKQGNPKSRSNPNGQRETQFGVHSLQRQIGPFMKTTSKPFFHGLLWADTVKRKKVAVAFNNLYNYNFVWDIIRRKWQWNVCSIFTKSSKTPSIWLFLRAVIFTRHGHLVPQLSAWSFFFYAFLIQSETPAVCVHIWAIGFFHFLLVFLSLPQLWTFRTTPLTDAWQAGDELAQEHVGAKSSEPPAAAAASPLLPLSSSLFFSFPLSLSLSRSVFGADSLAPAPWRHPIHSSPRASPRGAAEAVSMATGFGLRGGSQLINLGPNRGFGSFIQVAYCRPELQIWATCLSISLAIHRGKKTIKLFTPFSLHWSDSPVTLQNMTIHKI